MPLAFPVRSLLLPCSGFPGAVRRSGPPVAGRVSNRIRALTLTVGPSRQADCELVQHDLRLATNTIPFQMEVSKPQDPRSGASFGSGISATPRSAAKRSRSLGALAFSAILQA